MSISKSGNKSHDDAVNTAEGVRQVLDFAASMRADTVIRSNALLI